MIYIGNFATQNRKNMKKILLSAMLLLSAANIFAQNVTTEANEAPKVFSGTIYEAEHDLVIRFNFYDKNIKIAGQEFMGEMCGYIDDEKDFRNWLIVDSEITSPTTAIVQIINDECSEDLEAQITYNADDDTFTLKQLDGSILKIARNRKWVKLPKILTFTRTRQTKQQ